MRLELVERETAVELRVAAAEHVEVDAVEDDDLHGQRSLVTHLARVARSTICVTFTSGGPAGAASRVRRNGDTSVDNQVVERAADVVLRKLDVPSRPVLAEEYEAAFLVTLQRRPRTVAVDLHAP